MACIFSHIFLFKQQTKYITDLAQLIQKTDKIKSTTITACSQAQTYQCTCYSNGLDPCHFYMLAYIKNNAKYLNQNRKIHEILITFMSKTPLIFNESVWNFAEPARPSMITFYVTS